MTAPVLTRIQVNRRNRAARSDLADRNGLHKTLMRLLPDDLGPAPRAAGALLFRLEAGPGAVLLVQTAASPNLAALPPGYGTAESRDLSPVLGALTHGLPVRYRITAAATAARIADAVPHPVTGRRRGKITPLHGDEALAWWQRRAAGAGLEVTTGWTTPRPFPRADRDQPSPVHTLTQFDGTATVTDPHQLATALRTGIGRGKAYGAGLLTLAPT